MPLTRINRFQGEYRFLSNFWMCPVFYEGKLYPSSEHAYQAAKTLREGQREYIRSAKTAGSAKRRGREITLRPDWDEVKVDVMRAILEEKFGLDHLSVGYQTGKAHKQELAEKLLATGDAVLIEGNTWGDTFWGVCKGSGQNWLGFLLMEIRMLLRERNL
jgi:ribA/ribD-fused uncharacterized protein